MFRKQKSLIINDTDNHYQLRSCAMLVKLNTFKVLAECGSYTEAAKRLFCSQPSVSQQIQYLEKHYQSKLVIRKKNGIELTEKGILLKAQTEQLLKLYEEMERTMASAGPIQQPVALYMSHYIAENYYGELFDARYPCCQQCPWEINGHCYKELRKNLIEKKTKFAIMPIYPADRQIQQSYKIQPLFEEELYLVFSSEHALAKRKLIYAKDLQNLPVLLTQSVYLQDLVKQALKEKGVAVFYMQMTDFKIIKKALEQNTGVSFIPKKALDLNDSSLVCRSIKGMRIVRENGLVIDPSQELSPSEQAYCRHITEKLSS